VPRVSAPRLTGIALHVRDLDGAVRFYSEAFGIAAPQPASAGDGVEPRLAFEAGGETTTASAEVAFLVDDLASAHSRAVAAGAVVVREPHAEPPGRAASYLDLDGNVVSLVERARPLRVAGVDIAGGGWAVVVLEGARVADAFRCETFADALLVDAEVIAVDIPIGLP
jgi:predicted enzyme related to lactoylglutathione lyase